MKCDKAKPHCTSCVQNRTTHLCHYEEQPWAFDSELQKLKEQVFQLQQQNNELKNLLNKRTLVVPPAGVSEGLIVPDQTHDDPFLQLAESFDMMMLKEDKIGHYGSSSYMALMAQDPILRQMLKKHMDLQTMGINFEKYFLYDQGLIPVTGCGHLNTKESSIAGIFVQEENGNSQSLLQTINNSLPQKDILMLLIEHFFSEAYAFVPFVDEISFRKNVESLVSTTPEGKAILVLSNVKQYVSVSVLLCVLRFSFISLPLKNSPMVHNSVVQQILDSGAQIPPTVIEYSKGCISKSSVLRKPSLKHIQALLLLRLYRFYAPEDGDESTDSTIFLALIVQISKMHGMHRDPSRFSLIQGHATALLWKKIWVKLMYLDAVQALHFGCPLLIDDEYDTELPIPSSKDSAMEKSCIEDLVKINEVTQLIRGLLKSGSSIRSHPKRSDLERQLKTVEYTLLKYRTIADLTDLSSPMETFLAKTAKIAELARKLVLYNLHAVFSYILMLTCGPSELTAFHKYSVMATESSFIMFRLCHGYASDPSRYNETLHFESFISAYIFESSKRVLQHAWSFSLRDMAGTFSLHIIEEFKFPDSQGLDQWLAPFSPELSISDTLVVRILEYIQACSRLSQRYFVCWRAVFLNKLFGDYIDSQYPGKLEQLHLAVTKYNESKTGEIILLNIPELMNEMEETHTPTGQMSAMWNQLSKEGSDYLDPKLNFYDALGDPFFNTSIMDYAGFTFPELDSIINANIQANDSGLVSINDSLNQRDSVTTNSADDISPSTEGDLSDLTSNTAKFPGFSPGGDDIQQSVLESIFGSGLFSSDIPGRG